MGRTVRAIRVCGQSWTGADFKADDVIPTIAQVELDNGERAFYTDGVALRQRLARYEAVVEAAREWKEAMLDPNGHVWDEAYGSHAGSRYTRASVALVDALAALEVEK